MSFYYLKENILGAVADSSFLLDSQIWFLKDGFK